MKTMILLILLIIPLSDSLGTTPTFSNITSSQVEGILNDFATNFFPTTVSPASTHGKLFGTETSLTGGTSDSPTINGMVSENFGVIPKVGATIIFTFPKGLGFEVILLPLNSEGLEFSFYSYGIGWTITNLLKIPIDIKLRAQSSSGDLRFNQNLSGNNIGVSYSNKSMAYNATFSKKFFIFEPFFGAGYISSENTLSSSGAVSIFDAGVTSSQKNGVKINDFYYFIGGQLNLFLANFAVEMTRVFDNNIYMTKFGFYY